MIAAAAAILWCALRPEPVAIWWSTAFEPLCDGLAGAEGGADTLVLRSRLWDWLMLLRRG